MPLSIPRRAALELTAAGLAGLAVGCEAEPGETCGPSRASPAPAPATEPALVEDIAAWMLATPEGSLVGDLRAQLAAGWTVDSVFAALLLVGARGIDSKYGGGGFHYVLVVDALRHFASRGPEAEALVPLVYGILQTRRTVQSESFALPALDLGSLPSADGAEDRLFAAAAAGAVEEALREVTSLVRSPDPTRAQAALIELGPRRMFQLGHEAICAAKVVALLRALPGAWAEDVYRAATFMFVSQQKVATSPAYEELWGQNRARVAAAPCGWLTGEDRPDSIRTIHAALRDLDDPHAAVAVVEAQLDDGVSARTLWDGIILTAADRAFGSGDVHALTAIEAHRDMYLAGVSEHTGLLLLLQGAAHVAASRPPSKEVFLDLAPPPVTLDEVFAVGGPGSVARALGYLQSGGDPDAFVARLLVTNNARTSDEHAYKGAHSALAEADRVPPEWRSHLLAISRVFGPTDSAPLNQAWTLVAPA